MESPSIWMTWPCMADHKVQVIILQLDPAHGVDPVGVVALWLDPAGRAGLAYQFTPAGLPTPCWIQSTDQPSATHLDCGARRLSTTRLAYNPMPQIKAQKALAMKLSESMRCCLQCIKIK